MSPITAEVSSNAQKAYQDSKTAFEAVPTATYDVTIAKIEVIKFANSGQYASKNALNVQLRVIDSAPVGAKRVFFLRVPLFDKFAPSQKYPDGSPAFGYFQFFEAVGVPDEAIAAGQLGEIRDYLGRRLSAKIVRHEITEKDAEHHRNKDTNELEPWNEVDRVYVPRANAPQAPSASLPQSGVNVWDTAAQTVAPVTVATPAPAAPPASANVWGVSAAEAQSVVPAAQPGQAAAAPVTDIWGQQTSAPGMQEAAASGKTF